MFEPFSTPLQDNAKMMALMLTLCMTQSTLETCAPDQKRGPIILVAHIESREQCDNATAFYSKVLGKGPDQNWKMTCEVEES
jgi:hypothetical protein